MDPTGLQAKRIGLRISWMNQLNKLSQAEAKSDHKVPAVAVDEEDEIENVLCKFN